MIKTAETYNTALSTPLGRAIWAKYLISSKYLRRIQNAVFSEEHLVSLREAALLLTWTRARPQDDSYAARTHIANSRVSQPPQFGGLSLKGVTAKMHSPHNYPLIMGGRHKNV